MRAIIYKLLFIACILLLAVGNAQTPTSTENYIMSIEPLVPMSSVPEDLSQLDDDEKKVTIMYYDGLGREKQLIEYQQSYFNNVNSDKVTHFEYDEFGRKIKDYLPVPSSQANGVFITNPTTAYTNYYGTGTAYNTEFYYSEKELEASPLNRVLDQAAPGDDWAQGSGHEIKFDYLSNDNNEVELFYTTTTWNNTDKVYKNTLNRTGKYYDDGELYKTLTTDENGNNIEEFKNKSGQVILKRTYEGSNHLDTYYVYNKYDNLVFVVPPLAVSTASMSSDKLNGLCYQYNYDEKNRLGQKKLPGKNWEYMLYDKQDRLVAVQDGVQRATNKWLFTKYDKYGRVVYTGITNGTFSTIYSQIQSAANFNNEQRDDKEGFTLNGLLVNYTRDAFPTTIDEILTVNYYDDYKFERNLTIPQNIFGVPVITHSPQTATHNVTTKTLLTASMVRILATDTWEKSYLFYGEKLRVLETKKFNHLDGYTITDNEYDFRGKVLQAKTLHSRTDTTPEIKVEDFYTYNQQEQLLTQTRKVNNGTEERIADNAYGPLGQLIRKGVGNTATLDALQEVDYQYNIRGWLTDINDVDNLAQSGDPVDLFTFRINYNNAVQSHFPSTTGIEPLFNGNIAETFWRTVSDNKLRGYGYHYDELNRLRDAFYQKPGATAPVPQVYDEYLEYDLNGNITKLKRYSGNDTPTGAQFTDFLGYTYFTNTNKLKKVADATNAPEGFKDGTNTGDDYTYDVNGNMLTDKNKGITTGILYNYLNLPTKIQFTSTQKIEYLYNAAGVKIQKKVTDGSTIKTTEYLDGFQYENQLLQFFPHSEGYVRVTTKSINPNNPVYDFNYAYNYTDHLGNIRLTYAKDPQTGNLKVMEENHYYPFGLKHQNYGSGMSLDFQQQLDEWGVIIAPTTNNPFKYKYNGKELQDELGLNMYHMDMRQYDPAIAKWVVMDPVVHHSMSPYNAFDNNPVFWADPSGADGEHYNWETERYEDDKGKAVTFEQAMASQGLNTDGSEKEDNEECCKKIKQLINWFNGANYDGSGWGHGLRSLLKETFNIDNNSSNLIETGILSMLQAGEVNLQGSALKKLSNDPSIISYEASLILQAMADSKFKKQAFSFKSKKGIQFGGKRAEGEMWNQIQDPLNPAYRDTWLVAMNELTWLVRSTIVSTTISVDSKGNITMYHSFSDVFDLRPSAGRSDAYNKITKFFGLLYHDALGGNDKMKVNASWKKNY